MLQLEVREHGLDHHVDDFARVTERSAPATWLAVDADAQLDLAFWQLEDRFA